MTNINRTMLAVALALISVTSVFGQSANRTMVGVPAAPQQSKITIVETAEARRCRLHCGSLAATPIRMKSVASASEQQMRADACGKKMIRTR